MSVHDVKLFGDQVAASRLETRFAALGAEPLLRLAIEHLYRGRIALVSSFGADSAVLLHMVAQIDRNIPVIFVDTDRLFGETLAYRDKLVAHLGLSNVQNHKPDAGAVAANDAEGYLWFNDPDRCCDMRKVQPLDRALEGYEAWITGRKRFQAQNIHGQPIAKRERRDHNKSFLQRHHIGYSLFLLIS